MKPIIFNYANKILGMKRSIFNASLFFLLFSSAARAQSPRAAEARGVSNPWEIGFYISPSLTDLVLVKNSETAIVEFMFDERKENELPKLSMSAGFALAYRLNRRFGLETGLQYSNLGYKTKKTELGLFPDEVDPNFGFVRPGGNTGSNPSQMQIFYSFHYLGIPFKVNYRKGRAPWFFVSSLGLNAEFLLSARQRVILYGSDDSKERRTNTLTENFNAFNLSPSLSLGLEYRFTKQLCLRAEPTINYGLLQIRDSPISGHLWSAGMRIGCFWNL